MFWLALILGLVGALLAGWLGAFCGVALVIFLWLIGRVGMCVEWLLHGRRTDTSPQ